MSTDSRNTRRAALAAWVASALAVIATGSLQAAPSGDAEARVSSSRQSAGGRDGTPGERLRREDRALVTTGARSVPPAAGKPGDSTTAAVKGAASNDFWFFRADVILFNDDDRDGYFRGIDLLFDADTYFEFADVYAVAYLSYEGGPWNEYAVTDTFTIYGADSEDEYVIVTDLESGYPTGNYDLLIELYDAFDDSFLADFGPADTSALGLLPLEDFNRDAPIVDDVIVGGGGGGWGLALLALAFAIRRGRRLLPVRGRARCA